MEYNSDSVGSFGCNHLPEQETQTNDSERTLVSKKGADSPSTEVYPSEGPGFSEVYKLLLKVKEDGFVPNVKFEKLLLSLFHESLSEFARYSQDESGTVLEVYLECMIIVCEKDVQFFRYIENLNDDVCNYIIEIARKEDLQQTKPELYKFLLIFANLLLVHISSKRSILMGLSFHLVLLTNTKAYHVEHVLLAFDAVMIMMESKKIFQELSHVAYLNSSLALISSLKKSQADHVTCLQVVEKILKFSISISSNITLKIDQLKSLSKEISEQCALFSQHANLFQHLQAVLNDAIELNGDRSINTLTKRSSLQGAEDRCVYLKISQLKINPNVISKLASPRMLSSSKLVRNGVVTLQDPETHVYRALAKASDLDDKLAEPISGMLNTNRGGKIHIGINKSGLVVGVHITHKERDFLRCGIDSLLRKVIKPALPPNALDVQFIPVRSLDGSSDDNLVVVVLTVPSNMNTLYYLAEKQSCFLRLPKGNVKLTLAEVRQQAILLTEKRYLRSTQ